MMIDRILRSGLVLTAAALTAWVVGRAAIASDQDPEDDLEAAIEAELDELAIDIRTLQPRISDSRATRLAGLIRETCESHGIEPRLVAAMVMRESSFSPAVERLEVLGRRGERGLLQVMPGSPALAMRPPECPPSLEGARCQIETGVAWLAHARDHCPGTTWRWVAAYGLSRCPSESEAVASREVAIVQRYLAQMGREGGNDGVY